MGASFFMELRSYTKPSTIGDINIIHNDEKVFMVYIDGRCVNDNEYSYDNTRGIITFKKPFNEIIVYKKKWFQFWKRSVYKYENKIQL